MDVTSALARLRPTTIHPLRRFAWWVTSVAELAEPVSAETEVGYRDLPAPPPVRRVASAEQRRDAERLGFRRLGAFRQTTVLVYRLDTEVFLDHERIVRLSSSRTFDAFDTFLDDGSCLITWIRLGVPGGPRTMAATGEVGTGDIERDLERHRERVARVSLAGRTPLTMGGAQDYIALAEQYLLREAPLRVARGYATLALAVVAFFIFIAALVISAIVRAMAAS